MMPSPGPTELGLFFQITLRNTHPAPRDTSKLALFFRGKIPENRQISHNLFISKNLC